MGYSKSSESYRVYSCPQCGQRHCSHRTTNYWIHVGKPLQACRKCQTEFRVDTTQEWELLTPDERTRYLQQIGFETVMRCFGGVLFSAMVSLGIAFVAERQNVAKIDKVFPPVMITCLAIAALFVCFRIYQAIQGIFASKSRTADVEYRQKAAQLKPWYSK